MADDGITWDDVTWDDAKKRIDAVNVLTPHEKALALTRQQNEQEFNPASGGHPLQRVVEGLGSFWPSVNLATRQAAASLGYGDKDALSQEAAQKKQIDAPLNATPGGAVGKFLPDLGLAFAGGNVGKAGMAVLPSLARNAGTGAFLSAIEPKEDYSLGRELWRGAAQGGASELAGQTAGRAALPFRKQSEGAAHDAAIIESAGLPNPLISTQTTEGIPRQMTEAATLLNPNLKAKRDQNLEWFTRQQTKDAGMEVPALTGQARIDMADRLNNQASTFAGNGVNANAADVISSLQNARTTLGNNLAATGQTGVLKKFDDAIATLRNEIGAQRTAHSLSADDLMKRRSIASTAAHDADNAAEREAYNAIRDAYDEAFVAANPHMRSDFERWKAEYSHFKDVNKAADKGLAGDYLKPKNMLSSMVFGDTVARTPGERFTQAAANMIQPPSTSTWDRTRFLGTLLGAPIAAGGVGALAGTPGFGTALGLGTGAAFWNAVSRKPVSPATAEIIRQLTAGGTNAALARAFGQ
jgi:hypothetical protein